MSRVEIPSINQLTIALIKESPDSRAAGRRLRRAIEVIETYGWQQGTYGNDEIGFCTVGALCYDEGEVATNIRQRSIAIWNAYFVLEHWLTENFGCLVSVEAWNDRQVTSQDDVLSYLRKAADDLDPQT